MRLELPAGVSTDEAQAIRAALEEYARQTDGQPGEWGLAARRRDLRLGLSQARAASRHAWRDAAADTFDPPPPRRR